MGKKAGKKAKPAAPAAVVAEDSDDGHMEAEDIDFVQQNAESLGFLSAINSESLTSVKKQPKEKQPRRIQPKVAAPAELTESEDDGDSAGLVAEDSDSDMEVLSGDEDDDIEDGSDEDLEADSDEDLEVDSDEDLEDEDLEDEDDTNKDYVNSKDRRALKRKAMFGGEMDYEQSARSFKQPEKKVKESTRLPIKRADGRLALPEYSDEEMEASEGEAASGAESGSEPEAGEEDDDDDKSAKEQDREDEEELVAGDEPDRASMSRKAYIIAQQNRLAHVADLVMQNPEENLSQLKTLHAISASEDARVRRLGLLTQLAVFNDILPGYRIRELTAKEKEMRVTKEVRQQRMYEERLVRGYSQFLKQLFATARRAMRIFKDPQADIEGGVVAARALGELINAHPHFNFRRDVLSALVDIYVQPPARINFAQFTPMAQTARLAVLRLFRDDVSGEVSQIAVVLAAKRIKRLSYRVDASALRPWLHLRLRDELRTNPEDRKRAEAEQRAREQRREQQKLLRKRKGGAALKDAKRQLHMSKKQAKLNKTQQEVDRSLRDAEAEVSRDEREKWFGETLKQVFVTYFRILKQKDSIGPLLPAVLEGLARYAHLISVEFFVDLFGLLKLIMRGQHGVGIGAEEHGDDAVSARISLRTALLCILTALHILTGQGEALNLDIRDFYFQLYALLPALAMHTQIEATRVSLQSDGTRFTVYLAPAEVAALGAQTDADGAVWEDAVRSEADLLFECLHMMFLGRTKVTSLTRVAAFCKRVVVAAVHWPPRTAERALDFVRRLLARYPALDRLVSSEDQAGSGVYLRDLDDPDMCNPFATCLYELHWLQIHFHPRVQAAAARLLAYAKAEAKKRQQ